MTKQQGKTFLQKKLKQMEAQQRQKLKVPISAVASPSAEAGYDYAK
jgi:hypothetical protein